jgi:hypothetical protein
LNVFCSHEKRGRIHHTEESDANNYGYQQRREEKGFSTLRVLDPVQNDPQGSIASGAGLRSNGSTGSQAEDLMQIMFKQFNMWYTNQNSDGTTFNSIKFNLYDKIILDSGTTDYIFCNK